MTRLSPGSSNTPSSVNRPFTGASLDARRSPALGILGDVVRSDDETTETETGTQRDASGVASGLIRPGGISYLHIPATDVRRAADLYEIVFGWNVSGHDTDRPRFDDGTGHVSGAWMTDQAISREPGLLPYIYVERIEESVEQIKAHGGQVVTGPCPEGNLRGATFRDSGGNLIGLWQQARR